MQKSVFAAPGMDKKDLVKLQLSLRQLFARRPLSPGDSVCILPLRNEYVPDIEIFGDNNMRTLFEEKKLKVML